MTEDVKNDLPEDKKEDISKLSDSDIRWRAKYKGTREELENFKINAEKEKKSLEENINSFNSKVSAYEKRMIETEVKSQAIAAGIKDVEFVKLVDMSSVKLDENGNIIGADTVIKEFKARKPDCFGAEKKFSSSSNYELPEQRSSKLDARSLSSEDWKKNRNKYMGGRFK